MEKDKTTLKTSHDTVLFISCGDYLAGPWNPMSLASDFQTSMFSDSSGPLCLILELR